MTEWTRSRLDQIYILCSGGSSRDCWGAASRTASPTAQGAPGRLDSPAWRRGHEYSQTCVYKDDIKICTVASFQCVWKLLKVTNLKCAKNSFVKKPEKKKNPSLATVHQEPIWNIQTRLLDTYPEQMEIATMSVRAKGSAVFYGKS